MACRNNGKYATVKVLHKKKAGLSMANIVEFLFWLTPGKSTIQRHRGSPEGLLRTREHSAGGTVWVPTHTLDG